ncbi:MAG: asparagine synthase (glutamine-hydrolyzing) [Cyclobacteriaceae bacterium]|nr:asparagine synthase (glutamine-hydrolyzing) [Cyclobacteriaceae bacterium]
MCGIVGGFSSKSFSPSKVEMQECLEILRFRGPDAQGDYYSECNDGLLSLGHTRLSIIDTSDQANQPMVSHSGKTVIVFNGEIYNYQYLRKELEHHDFTFRSNSDTEVILNGFEYWGIDKTLQKLDGMFAFALFDFESQNLFLARDRFGKKPLYYYNQEGQFLFSSDIRVFPKISNVKLSLNYHSLGYYFSELSTPMTSSIWKEVEKVPPATYLKYNLRKGVLKKEYWTYQYTESCTLSGEEIQEHVEGLIAKAVKKRMVSDVGFSVLLSGGIDSSLVATKLAEEYSGRVNTFSVGFQNKNFDELVYANEVAEKINSNHHPIVIDKIDYSILDDLILEYGEPFADSSMIPSYLISREVAKTQKVVLGGDGGDELFGGYHNYYLAYKYDKVKNFGVFSKGADIASKVFPSYRTKLLSQLLNYTKVPEYQFLNRNMGFSVLELKQLFPEVDFTGVIDDEHKDILERYSPASKHTVMNLMSSSYRTRLANDYLVKIDRASMYASLEMRSPFLDKELAEFAFTLKPNQLFQNGEPKSILKNIARKYYGNSFVYRKKMGFGIPIGDWFRKEGNKRLKEVLFGNTSKQFTFSNKHLEKLILDHEHGKDYSNKLFSIYSFKIWENSVS